MTIISSTFERLAISKDRTSFKIYNWIIKVSKIQKIPVHLDSNELIIPSLSKSNSILKIIPSLSKSAVQHFSQEFQLIQTLVMYNLKFLSSCKFQIVVVRNLSFNSSRYKMNHYFLFPKLVSKLISDAVNVYCLMKIF